MLTTTGNLKNQILSVKNEVSPKVNSQKFDASEPVALISAKCCALGYERMLKMSPDLECIKDKKKRPKQATFSYLRCSSIVIPTVTMQIADVG